MDRSDCCSDCRWPFTDHLGLEYPVPGLGNPVHVGNMGRSDLDQGTYHYSSNQQVMYITNKYNSVIIPVEPGMLEWLQEQYPYSQYHIVTKENYV